MLLKNGSIGEDVKKLQEKLGLNPDGSYGSGTEGAVKEWQSKNGLTPDGVVGHIEDFPSMKHCEESMYRHLSMWSKGDVCSVNGLLMTVN